MFRVEELIAHARAGRLRVPSFQRGFRWDREDVQKLIDSIWRGYPIGALLLWSKAGPPGRVPLGDLVFDVGEQRSAWFVVDGQQRIISLVSTLLPAGGRAETFDLYFDLETETIVPPPRGGTTARHLPLDRVVDSEELLAWIDDHRAALAPEQVRLALRVGKALREYELPAYVISADDELAVREIFLRINTTGKALEVREVFDALQAPIDRKPAVSLEEVVDRLRARSLGELDEHQASRAVLAIEQEDPTGSLQQLAGVNLPAAIERVERALDRVLGFLAQDAGIPHLRLLPYQSPLDALAAYFDRFPMPSPRARRLLTRWLWRGVASGELRGDSKQARAALEAAHAGRSDEEAARGVLATVSARRPELNAGEWFNLRHAHSRIAAIALVELRPHHLRTGALLDVGALLESTDEPVAAILRPIAAKSSPNLLRLMASVGNRLLHPTLDGEPVLPMLIEAVQLQPLSGSAASPHVLASHAISADAARALRDDDHVRFLELRRDQIEAAAARLVDRHAEWDHSDRPSIASLIDEED